MIMTQKSLFLNILFSLRSQLPQNSKILYFCFRRRLLQNRHGSEWNITLCVVLVSHYMVQELILPNCLRHYLFEIRKSQTGSKSIKKTTNSSKPLCYGFFSVDIEYIRQYSDTLASILVFVYELSGSGLSPVAVT